MSFVGSVCLEGLDGVGVIAFKQSKYNGNRWDGSIVIIDNVVCACQCFSEFVRRCRCGI